MALWTPAEITTLRWLDASDSSTITIATGVSEWRDKSGNSGHAAQATTAYQPVVTSAGMNGLDIVTFDGSNDVMQGPFAVSLTAESVFVVFTYSSGGSNGRFFTQSDTGQDFSTPGPYIPFLRNAATTSCGSFTGSFVATQAIAYNTPGQFSSIQSSTTISNRLNGASAVTSAHTLSKTYTRYLLGGATDTTGRLAGSIAEIIVLNNDATTSERQIIEGYLAWKWGIEASLPSGHPYEFAAPTTSTSTDIKAHYEQGYELYASIMAYIDQSYEISTLRVAYFNQLYTDLLSAYYTQWYDDKDILKAHYSQWYKDRGLLNRFWEQKYGDSQAINRYWDLQYAITTTIKDHHVQVYNILSTLNKAHFEQLYSIKNSEFIKNYYAAVYGIEADGNYLKQNNSLTINGVEVDFIIAESEYSQSSYVGSLDIVIPSLPDWLSVDFLQSMIFTAGTDVYEFVVTDKNKKETVKGMSLSITGMSQGITLDFPYADPVLDSFTYGFASDMCIALAALQGITFTWESQVDWVLTKDDINLTGESPLSGMRQIINSIGSILQSNPDGTMYSTPKDVVNTHQYAAANVDYFLTVGEDFISTETSPDKRSGFNTYSISNIADSSLYVIEIESISDFEKIVKVYQPVWDDTDVILETSDLSSVTIARLADVSNELICDSIEIINGSGVSSKPIFEVRDHEYTGRTDLGGITTSEEGVVTCVTAGESILALKYFSRYRQWRVINTDVEQVQFILKTVE